jgi:hypothetical protein
VAFKDSSWYEKRDVLWEGIKRNYRFWAFALPIYGHYRVVQWECDFFQYDEAISDAKFNKLHDTYSPRSKEITLELRGFYLKNAQFFSMLDSGFVPPQYMEWLVHHHA